MKPNHNHPVPRNKNSRRWPMIIIGMLFAHVLLMMTCVVIVLQRPGESAIISDYYNKAQAYDYYKQQLTASQKLGWKTDLEQTDQTDGLGHRRMTLSLSDSKNQPLAGATVNVHCFHWSTATRRKRSRPAPPRPGNIISPSPPNTWGSGNSTSPRNPAIGLSFRP